MRIIFAGTPQFAVTPLTKLHDKHQIVAVFTQPDKAQGRGKKITTSAVKNFAIEHNLPIYQPTTLVESEVLQYIKNLNADIMVVVAYGQILPQPILNLPKYGCLNIHASLLPRWRGAAPIQRAILAGDTTTGISIMQMDTGLDTGDVLLNKTCTITNLDTAQTLHNKLAILGSDAIIEVLTNFISLTQKPQNGEPTYAKKLTKDEAWINWQQTATQINRQIRAFNPYPIAQTYATSNKFENQVLRILNAKVVANNGENGEIVITKNSVVINTNKDGLSLKIIQLTGKKAISISDFNNAHQLLSVC